MDDVESSPLGRSNEIYSRPLLRRALQDSHFDRHRQLHRRKVSSSEADSTSTTRACNADMIRFDVQRKTRISVSREPDVVTQYVTRVKIVGTVVTTTKDQDPSSHFRAILRCRLRFGPEEVGSDDRPVTSDGSGRGRGGS